MAQALYRKYRSQSLDQVVGQDHITKLLGRAIDQGRVAHAYLFTGPRGVGKTSVARILAYQVNGFTYGDKKGQLDIIEIDAASNNGVEDIRELRDKVQIAPAVAPYKVYIIDEVHMLSKAAFNALLKTLEEPPAHAIFILATTDADKLPPTIISRTQQYAFHAPNESLIAAHLQTVAEAEKIAIEQTAVTMLAQLARGSFRDSLSLLDQVSHLSSDQVTIASDDIKELFGLAPTEALEELLTAISEQSSHAVVTTVTQLLARGVQPTVLADQLTVRLTQELATSPRYSHLIDKLLDVASSHHPEMKLLAVVVGAASEQPRTIATRVETPKPITASVDSLKTKKAPKPTTVSAKIEAQPQPASDTPVTDGATLAPRTPKGPSLPFDWDRLVSSTKETSMALASVLERCGHHFEDDTLTLYTGSVFYKKKLDDSKYRLLLQSALRAVGYDDITIQTVAEAAPIHDNVLASVAAVMGGGEQVEVA